MPVWQKFWQQVDPDRVVLLAIAMDAQCPEALRPYVQAAGVTYPTLVDRTGQLSLLYDFEAVPNAWIVDEVGVIRFRERLSFNIGNVDTAREVREVLALPPGEAPESRPVGSSSPAAEAFRLGVEFLNRGRRRAAVEQWLRAAEAAPTNWIFRKQLWYLLHPERFQPRVDYTWQAAQKAREARQGLRAANPIPDEWED